MRESCEHDGPPNDDDSGGITSAGASTKRHEMRLELMNEAPDRRSAGQQSAGRVSERQHHGQLHARDLANRS